jgi:hypothetical protein
MFTYLSPDLGPLNTQIALMGIPNLKEEMFIFGGKGFGYVSRNIRIGGMGGGGEVTTDGVIEGDPTIETDDLAKEVAFSLGFGGVTVEYTYNTPLNIQLVAGGMLGWGGITVRISQFQGVPNWEGIWEDYQTGYTGDSYDLTVYMNNSIFILNPWIGAEYKILPWMGIAGKAGYFYSKASRSNWNSEGTEIFGGEEIDLSNVSFEVAIIFGS